MLDGVGDVRLAIVVAVGDHSHRARYYNWLFTSIDATMQEIRRDLHCIRAMNDDDTIDGQIVYSFLYKLGQIMEKLVVNGARVDHAELNQIDLFQIDLRFRRSY